MIVVSLNCDDVSLIAPTESADNSIYKGLWLTNIMAETPNAPPPAPLNTQQSVPSQQLNTVNARMRLVESRVDEIRKMVDLVEKNMLDSHQKLNKTVKSLQSEIDAINRTIKTVEDRIVTIIKELRLTSKKEDVMVLKKYLDLWNPVKFVTVDKAESMIRDILNEKKENITDEPSD